MNNISVLVAGNGLDISLGMNTKISDFLFWVENLNELKLLKIVRSKENKKCFTKFKDSYNNWHKTNDKLNNHWSDLENNIVDFFTNFKNDYVSFKKACKGKWQKIENAYIELKKGYEIFSFLMQYFYIKKINKSVNGKDGKILKSKIERFCQWIEKIDTFISLNYTNIKDFTHKNSKLNFNPKIKVYYLHYISFGLTLDNYLRGLDFKRKNDKFLNYSKLGDANEIFDLATSDLDKEIRTKYCEARFTKSQHCVRCSKFTSGIAKYYQFLILGNSNTSFEIYNDTNYKFLFKNDNDNLFLKNYPKLVLKNILNKMKSIEEEKFDRFLYVFGYSFGEADFTFNDFLRTLIKNKKYKFKYIFFKEDKEKHDLLKENMFKCNSFYERFNINNKYESLELFKENIEFI